MADAYLRRVRTPEVRIARDRMLVAPDHESWGGSSKGNLGLLRQVGVFDGVRLLDVEEGPWSTGFDASKGYFSIPALAPSGWSSKDWSEYRDAMRSAARPAYSQGWYVMQGLRVLPGLDQYASFDEDVRIAFMNAVFASAGQWGEQWATITVRRTSGKADSFVLASPVAWQLRRLAWISVKSGDSDAWRRPSDCWHVPAHEMAGNRGGQFVHLQPLPASIANLLDTQPRLAQSMQRLEMPRFDLETRSQDTRLLEALADAVEAKAVRNWDVLLGQVRGAWGGFDPQPYTTFPRRVLIHEQGGRLSVGAPSEEHRIYLPDTKKAFVAELRRFQLPVIAIETADAVRLAERFVSQYPAGIARAATLQTTPLIDDAPLSKPAEARLQDNERLDWLIPVVLTIVANYGPEAQGTGTKAFRRYLDKLRQTRVDVCDSIKLALYDNDRLVAEPIPVSALWHNESHTLLVRNPSVTDAADISEALASLLERDDMEVPIRLLLNITGWDPRSPTSQRAWRN